MTRKTLASLAAELGVSRTTVSNAYNRPDQLSEGLRKRILAAAQARGYPGPHPTARSLRTRRNGATGVVMTEHLAYAFEDAASVDFLAGLASASDNMLTLIPVGPEGPAGVSPLISQAVVDGFVVYSVPEGDPNLAAVQATGLPVVVCDQPYDVPGSYVGIDDAEAITPAAHALLKAGHRRIGILGKRLTATPHDGLIDPASIEQAPLHVQRARLQGALRVFRAAGIEPPIVVSHHNDRHAARQAAARLLDSHDVSAVLCTTDSMALGALDLAEERGWRVPEELSITGFDGIDAARARGLSTIIQPNRAKGVEVAGLLNKAIDAAINDAAPPAPERVVLRTSFSAGRSIAAPRRQ